MNDVALTWKNRPVEPGIYFMKIDFPIRMREIDLKEKIEGKLVFAEDDKMKIGVIGMDDGTGKVQYLAPEAAKRAFSDDPSQVKWLDGVLTVKDDGIVYGLGLYVWLKKEWGVPDGLKDVVSTTFDKTGKPLKDVDSDGNVYDYVAQGLHGLGVAPLAFLGWAVVGVILSLIYQILEKIGLNPFSLTATTDKVSKAKKKVEEAADKIGNAAKWVFWGSLAIGSLLLIDKLNLRKGL